jgi:Fe-S-cluster containining protein
LRLDLETSPSHIDATVELSVSGHSLQIEMSIPAEPARPVKFLPLFQSLTDAVVGIATGEAEKEGLTVSCTKGCGACCRQLVPISVTEARRLRELIDEMPEPRRRTIRRRFDAGRERLEQAGMLEKLRDPERISKEDARTLGLEYFSLGIACPFLEEESCSIHSDRPIACREYLVTSPAENCSKPTAETVRCVNLPGKVSAAVRSLDTGSSRHPAFWVPLLLAPDWAAANPDDAPPRPGIEIIRELFGRLSRRDISGSNFEESSDSITLRDASDAGVNTGTSER